MMGYMTLSAVPVSSVSAPLPSGGRDHVSTQPRIHLQLPRFTRHVSQQCPPLSSLSQNHLRPVLLKYHQMLQQDRQPLLGPRRELECVRRKHEAQWLLWTFVLISHQHLLPDHHCCQAQLFGG